MANKLLQLFKKLEEYQVLTDEEKEMAHAPLWKLLGHKSYEDCMIHLLEGRKGTGETLYKLYKQL